MDFLRRQINDHFRCKKKKIKKAVINVRPCFVFSIWYHAVISRFHFIQLHSYYLVVIYVFIFRRLPEPKPDGNVYMSICLKHLCSVCTLYKCPFHFVQFFFSVFNVYDRIPVLASTLDLNLLGMSAVGKIKRHPSLVRNAKIKNERIIWIANGRNFTLNNKMKYTKRN